jgi:ribosomal protein L29
MIRRTLNVMHAKDLNQMSSDELRKMLADAKMRRMTIDAKNAGVGGAQPLVHPSGEARQNRKLIARCMTILVKRGERCV